MTKNDFVKSTTGVTVALFHTLRTSGKIFTASFVKKDGTTRKMHCRCNVKKHLKGGKAAYNFTEHGLLSVFDIDKMEYRSINLDTLMYIKFQGKIYYFNNLPFQNIC